MVWPLGDMVEPALFTANCATQGILHRNSSIKIFLTFYRTRVKLRRLYLCFKNTPILLLSAPLSVPPSSSALYHLLAQSRAVWVSHCKAILGERKIFNQVNLPNQKPLSILECTMKMNQTLRKLAYDYLYSSFSRNHTAAARLPRIYLKPFHLRIYPSDACPAMYQLPRQIRTATHALFSSYVYLGAAVLKSKLHLPTRAKKDGAHLTVSRENNCDKIELVHCIFKILNFKLKLFKSAVDPKQADPTCYGNLALSVPLAQGYIGRLGEIWLEMVSVSRDCNALPYFSVPDSVKKLFSIEFGRRKDLTFQWKRALMNNVTQNEVDISLLEFRIAKHTAFIRHWSKLLSEMKSLFKDVQATCILYLMIQLLMWST
ncbi:conserved hypothetical protein [Trichinella spiralis]|uniref:hypothetical protein n=1 Tax=Trichinella spiralis TaxID=6334 RepID=UPI0001EFE553|nr:conserved hypothetical protein [Trichinella spiralis]